ncbi:MAG: chorismate--pyruvate lyase [Enterobacterales bacterium]|jgi:chorismate--pyruvate lyase
MTTKVVMPTDQWISLADVQNNLAKTEANMVQFQWLSDQGSMTNRLIAAAEFPLTVKVTSSSEQDIDTEERAFLKITTTQSYVREVLMSIDNNPWLYGRTIIPHQTLQGDGSEIKLLGDKPLGQLLFKNGLNSRQFIEVATITKNHHLYPHFAMDGELENLWARRSMFLFNGSPLLVQEVFMPSCPFLQLNLE